MLLGYNTNGLQSHRLDDGLRLLADHGYQAVALTPDIAHLDPLRATSAEVDAIAALASRLSLQIVIETGGRFLLSPTAKHEPNLMTRDPQGRERRLEFYRRCAAIGRDLGAPVLSFWAGGTPGPDAAARQWLMEGIERTCALVRDVGLTPALEPEPGMAVETVAQWGEVRAALAETAPRLCLDVGHLLVTGEAAPEIAIPAHAPWLAQIHLEDMRFGVHEHLPPGEGDVDFGAVRAALEAADYTGAVCFELSRSSHCAPAMLALCRETWEAAGR